AVVPDRRDGSGLWLRVFATGDQRVWVQAEAVSCQNVDTMALLVDAAPPTPVPTATPTETPTETPTLTPSETPVPPTATALPTATPPPTQTATEAPG
ncbi:MAG: hypothetical protein JW910_12640, partial [Anaerolineae bacterium]|nr:hypothetical protein [Anaerolineae bacterium]